MRNLRRYINRLYDESQIVKLIIDYLIKDNEEDINYRPVKRRKS